MVELLCYADEHLGCAGATELLTFLSEKGRLLDTPGVIAACPGLLEGTLERYFATHKRDKSEWRGLKG